MSEQKPDDLVERLWASDEASFLTNQAARRIEKLEAQLSEYKNAKPVAWLRTSDVGSPVVTEEFLEKFPEHRGYFGTPLIVALSHSNKDTNHER